MTMSALELLTLALASAAFGAGGLWLWQRRRATQHETPLHDPLTGLPSRAAVLDALTRSLSLADRLQHPVTVMVVQIDDFAQRRQQNPKKATELERALAQRMAGRVRTHDLLASWDRGQYLAVLPDADVAHALVLAEDLRELAATHAGLACSVSIGLHSKAPGPDLHLHDLTASMAVAAQRALEATVANGPGRIEIEP
jgi:diguanylate cyclase (GGDEF)-like protein